MKQMQVDSIWATKSGFCIVMMVVCILLCGCSEDVIHEGSFTIETQKDLDKFNKYVDVEGGVDVHSQEMQEIELSNLERTDYSIRITNSDAALDRVSFPVLGSAGGISIENNSGLFELSFPSIFVLRDGLDISHNIQLTKVGEWSLESIYGSLDMIGNPMLVDLSGFNKLYRIDDGDLGVIEDASLTSLSDLTALVIIDHRLIVRDNPSLETLFVDNQLESIGRGVIITDNPLLTSIGCLKTATQNGADSTLDFAVEITGNASLPYCDICQTLSPIASRIVDEESQLQGNLPDACGDETTQKYSDLNCQQPQ